MRPVQIFKGMRSCSRSKLSLGFRNKPQYTSQYF